MTDIEIEAGGKVDVEKAFWLLAYDLKTEHIHKLPKKDREWLARKRVSVWYELRYRFKCAPVQKSLYVIRDRQLLDVLKAKVEEWIAEYAKHGYPANIKVFPIATTDQGYQTFKDMEFEFLMDWLGGMDKSMKKFNASRPPSKRFIGDMKRKLELVESIMKEDFNKQYSRYHEGEDHVQLLHDRIMELSQWAK